MKRTVSVIAPFVLFAAAGVAQAQFGPNLLNNPSFEDPLAYDFSDFSKWNGFFGGPATLVNFNTTGATPRTGAAALEMSITPPATGGTGRDAFTGMLQRVTGLTAGLTYELSVWARTNPVLLNGAEYRIEWQNGAGTEVSRTNVTLQSILTSTYSRQSFNDTCPAGATQAIIVLAIQSFDGVQGASAFSDVVWDDASFRTIPAPAAAVVLGFGGLLASRRRR